MITCRTNTNQIFMELHSIEIASQLRCHRYGGNSTSHAALADASKASKSTSSRSSWLCCLDAVCIFAYSLRRDQKGNITHRQKTDSPATFIQVTLKVCKPCWWLLPTHVQSIHVVIPNLSKNLSFEILSVSGTILVILQWCLNLHTRSVTIRYI